MLGLFDKLDGFDSFEEKQKMMAFFEGMTLNTYIISYLGKFNLGENAVYIDDNVTVLAAGKILVFLARVEIYILLWFICPVGNVRRIYRFFLKQRNRGFEGFGLGVNLVLCGLGHQFCGFIRFAERGPAFFGIIVFRFLGGLVKRCVESVCRERRSFSEHTYYSEIVNVKSRRSGFAVFYECPDLHTLNAAQVSCAAPRFKRYTYKAFGACGNYNRDKTVLMFVVAFICIIYSRAAPRNLRVLP